jgi:hypothetical protein
VGRTIVVGVASAVAKVTDCDCKLKSMTTANWCLFLGGVYSKRFQNLDKELTRAPSLLRNWAGNNTLPCVNTRSILRALSVVQSSSGLGWPELFETGGGAHKAVATSQKRSRSH